MSLPLGPNVYPTALMRSGLWCVGLLCAGRIYSGMVYFGSVVSGLSSCRPSWSGCGIGWRWGEVISSISMLCLLKSATGLLPTRSSPIMGHRPPFVFWSSWCKSRKVLWCLLVISFTLCLQPPITWVLFRGDRHFVHVGVGPCFLLHLCTWTPKPLRLSLFVPYMGRWSIRGCYGLLQFL